MFLNEAIAKRIAQLCAERNMTQYQLSKKSGVPRSTLSTVMKCTFPGVKMRIIYEVCGGFEMELTEFFDSELFSRERLED